jgi:hypothetical protein
MASQKFGSTEKAGFISAFLFCHDHPFGEGLCRCAFSAAVASSMPAPLPSSILIGWLNRPTWRQFAGQAAPPVISRRPACLTSSFGLYRSRIHLPLQLPQLVVLIPPPAFQSTAIAPGARVHARLGRGMFLSRCACFDRQMRGWPRVEQIPPRIQCRGREAIDHRWSCGTTLSSE